jgi:hypothetical protein
MNSTLKPRESDPHDVFVIAPDTVPAAWADKVLADIKRDAGSDSGNSASVQPPLAGSSAVVPKVDPAFRASAAADIRVPDIDVANDRPAGPAPTGSRMKGTIIAFLFALCSAFAAAGWQHYGAAARQMISGWMPPFALTSSLPPEPTGLAANPDTPDIPAATQAAPDDQAPPQPAPAQATDGAAPAAADAALVRSMARDLAAMAQEIVLLKATVAELKAAQQPPARDAAKTSDVKTSDLKTSQTNTSDVKPSAPSPRPRMAAPPPPPRPVAAPARRPMQTYSTQGYPAQGYPAPGYPAQPYPPAQAAAPPPLQQYPASMQPAPPPPTLAEDGEPVVRPPMPLH